MAAWFRTYVRLRVHYTIDRVCHQGQLALPVGTGRRFIAAAWIAVCWPSTLAASGHATPTGMVVREVHCNTCEGGGAGLRTYLRGFRGVHKQYLHLYAVTYETMVNAKRITQAVVRRMCFAAP